MIRLNIILNDLVLINMNYDLLLGNKNNLDIVNDFIEYV